MASPSLYNLSKKYDKLYVVLKSPKHQELLNDLGVNFEVIILNTKSKKSIINFFLKYSFRNNVLYAPLLSSRKYLQFLLSLAFKQVFIPSKLIDLKNLKELGKFNQKSTLHLTHYFNTTLLNNSILNNIYYSNYDFARITISKPAKIIIGVGLSCGILERHKIPNPAIFANFLNLISIESYDQINLYGTNEDVILFNDFLKHFTHKDKVKFITNLSFNGLRKNISECIFFISGTTGQGHIASTTNIPMVIFSGVTCDEASGPLVNNKLIIKHQLACGPCYEESFLFGCGRLCMDELFTESNSKSFINFTDQIFVANKSNISIYE